MKATAQAKAHRFGLRLALEERVRELVASHVLPRLDAGGRDFELVVPRYGLSSLVYLVEAADGPSFALRVAVTQAERIGLARRRRATRFWVARGLPTPREILTDLSPRALGGLGYLVEERVQGPNVVACEAASGAFEATGRALARVHGVTRRLHHGALFRPKPGRYVSHFLRRSHAHAADLAREGLVSEREAQAIAAFLGRFAPALRGLPHFELLHRRCTESDALFDPAAGEVSLLEPQRSGFGVFVGDLVRAEVRICEDAPERIARLHRGYFEAAPEEARARFEALAPAFRCALRLANARRWAAKMQQDRDGFEEAWRDEYARVREIAAS